MHLKSLFYLTLVLGVSGLAGSLFGQVSTRSWANAVDGPWDGTGNQWNNVPNNDNTVARFYSNNYAPDSAFTVHLTQNVINAYMRIDGNDFFTVTLNLNGFNYTAATGAGQGNAVTMIGRDAGDNNALILTGGGTFHTASALNIARAGSSTGHLTVTGTGTILSTGSIAETRIGTGTGTLEILNGGAYNSAGAVRVGYDGSGNGTVLVDNGTWTANGGEVHFGTRASGAQGFLTVRNGGVVQNIAEGTNGHINFAGVGGSSATALVTGEGSQLTGSGITIGGRGATAAGTALMTVSDGGSLSASTLRIHSGGTLVIDGGSASFTNIGTATLSVTGNIQLVLNGESAPLISVSQNARLDATDVTGLLLGLSLGEGVSYSLNDEIQLLRYGTLTGGFSNFEEGEVFSIGDYEFQFSYNMTSGANSFVGLTVTAVPEPGTLVLGMGVVVLLFVTRRKWRSA